MQSEVAHRFDRILIRLPNWLGDVLMARPLLHSLRAAYPDAEIRCVAPAGLLDLLRGERVINCHDAWPLRADHAARAHLHGELRRWRPEAALVLPPSFSSAWFARSTGAGVRVGYAHEWRSWTLTTALRRPARGDQHLSEEYRRLAAAITGRVDVGVDLPDLPVPEASAEAAVAAMAAGGAADRSWAILGPGAIYGPAKRWSAERFAQVGRRLAAQGLQILVCGTAEERDTCAAVAGAVGEGAVNLAGRTSLPALVGLCGRASVAVCNDSGLAHLSAALGTRTVAIFGSTSSAWTAPLGKRVRVVQGAPVCSPCFQRACRIGYECLERVSVDAVVRAVAELTA